MSEWPAGTACKVYPSRATVRFEESRARTGSGDVGNVMMLSGNHAFQASWDCGEICSYMCDRVPLVATAVAVGKRERRWDRPKKWSPWPCVM